jgi:hypothetical protein
MSMRRERQYRMTTKIKLPNVTLIAMTQIGYKNEDHKKAFDISCEGIEFGACKLIQLSEIHDVNSWNKAVIYELPKYIETAYCMLIHADGYVINPELWNPEWLSYDYIGAPWPLPGDSYSYRDECGGLVRVGNSVSLRSKKLMEYIATFPWRPFYGNTHEDGFISCHHRKDAEAQGFKYAPLEVAVHFSKEHEIPENKGLKTFAFHQV